jgi:hypothetical protein
MKHDILGEVELSDGQPFDAVVVIISNAQLSEAEFEAKLSLNAVNVTGDLERIPLDLDQAR